MRYLISVALGLVLADRRHGPNNPDQTHHGAQSRRWIFRPPPGRSEG